MNKLLENIKKIIPEVKEKIYMGVDLNSLISYSSYLLEKNNIPLTFENIYVTSYLTFPKKFCLVGFEEFPDGARINRAILQCLPKYQNLLIGKAIKGYSLTKFGVNRAQEVERKIKLRYAPNGKKHEDTLSNRTLDYSKKIDELANKPSFKRFLENKKEEIGVEGIFDFLEVSPYSSKQQIRIKMDSYQSLAKYGKSKALKEFLKWINSLEEFKVYLK